MAMTQHRLWLVIVRAWFTSAQDNTAHDWNTSYEIQAPTAHQAITSALDRVEVEGANTVTIECTLAGGQDNAD